MTLAAMLGHSKINMVLSYAHPTQEHQTKAMDKMERYVTNRRLPMRSEQRRKCLTLFNRGGAGPGAKKSAALATFSATVAIAALVNHFLSY